MRIIVADDDKFARSTLSDVLTAEGHDVILAGDGAEALDAVRQGLARLVITDWVMPGMDGADFCRHVRSEHFPCYIYIILLAARQNKNDIVDGLDAGADDYLGKPFHPAELQARIRVAERVLGLESRDVAIFAMAKLTESRDPETGQHLERIRRYSRILAHELGLDGKYRDIVTDEFESLIHATSPLHDIGKVGIPDCVLLKPDRLSSDEFEIMKTHTTIGAETLGAALERYPGTRYLTMARDIALTHHERFDGSGYPQGLRGEAIPLSGRIVALADVYDALTSNRVYKRAFNHAVTRSMIVEERGRHFDPVIVDAFEICESVFVETLEEYSDSPVVLT